jgi:hypothetical protein
MRMSAAIHLSYLLAPLAFASTLLVTSSDRSIVSVVGRTPPNEKVYWSGPEPRRLQVTFTTSNPPGGGTGWVDISKGSHSRAEITQALMEVVVSLGGHVRSHGPGATSFTIEDTPASSNPGTPEIPSTGPGFDSNKPSTQWYTKSD